MAAVFVQWVPMLGMLGRMLFLEGFRFVYLWGEMGEDEQDRSIKAFKTVPEIKVMVSSHCSPALLTTYFPFFSSQRPISPSY